MFRAELLIYQRLTTIRNHSPPLNESSLTIINHHELYHEPPLITINIGKTMNHPPVITILIGGMFPIPSHGWFTAFIYLWHCFSHISWNTMGNQAQQWGFPELIRGLVFEPR